MPSPTHNPGDQPRGEHPGTAPQDARPGRHPSAERTSGGRMTAIALAAILGLVLLIYIGRIVAASLAG